MADKLSQQKLLDMVRDQKPEAYSFELGKGTDKKKLFDMVKNDKELIVLRRTTWKK